MTQPQEGSRQDARDQADEHDSFVKSGTVKAHKTGEHFTIPSLMLLDDDQQAEYDALQHELNQCDRWPDEEIPAQQVPERTITDDGMTTTIAGHTIPGRTIRGDYMQPYQKDGDLLTPPYNVRIAKILLGDKYEAFKAGGGKSAEVVQELMRMSRESNKRLASDSKSADGSADSEGVPAAD